MSTALYATDSQELDLDDPAIDIEEECVCDGYQHDQGCFLIGDDETDTYYQGLADDRSDYYNSVK